MNYFMYVSLPIQVINLCRTKVMKLADRAIDFESELQSKHTMIS